MKEISKLLDYRPEIRVLDATLRDGGLVNNFRFSDEFVKDLYQTNIKAGVDYMEFGYKADTDISKEEDFGKWKFSKDEYLDDNWNHIIFSLRSKGMPDSYPKGKNAIDIQPWVEVAEGQYKGSLHGRAQF